MLDQRRALRLSLRRRVDHGHAQQPKQTLAFLVVDLRHFHGALGELRHGLLVGAGLLGLGEVGGRVASRPGAARELVALGLRRSAVEDVDRLHAGLEHADGAVEHPLEVTKV